MKNKWSMLALIAISFIGCAGVPDSEESVEGYGSSKREAYTAAGGGTGVATLQSDEVENLTIVTFSPTIVTMTGDHFSGNKAKTLLGTGIGDSVIFAVTTNS